LKDGFSVLPVILDHVLKHELQVLMDFPALSMTLPDGREESIMKRTTLVS